MRLVKQICFSYGCGCNCPSCTARVEGLAAGLLFYDPQGRLRLKDRPNVRDGQAVQAYMALPKHKRAAA